MAWLQSPLAPLAACIAVCGTHLMTERWFRGAWANRYHAFAHMLTGGYVLVSLTHFVWGLYVLGPHLLGYDSGERAPPPGEPHTHHPRRTIFSSLWCGKLPETEAVTQVLFFYFACKIWEGIDLVTVTLRGYPIIAHFRLHHYTTPLFAYLGWVSRSHHGALFLLLNTLMHVMVYAFFTSERMRTKILIRAIRFWQYVQLLTGIVVGLLAGYEYWVGGGPCSPSPPGSPVAWSDGWSDTVPAALFVLYLCLFQLELRHEAGAQGGGAGGKSSEKKD